MFPFFFIPFRYTENFTSYIYYYTLPSFKFSTGGSYNITFLDLVAYQPHLAIFTKSEQTDFLTLSPSAACNFSLSFPKITSDFPFVGSLDSDQTLYPTLIACRHGLAFTLSLSYENPGTFLDLRTVPSVYINVLLFCTFLIIGAVYGVLFVKLSIDHSQMNYILFGLLGLPAFDHLIRYLELLFLDRSDNDHGLSIVHFISHVLSYSWYTLVSLISVGGLSIVFETLPKVQYIEAGIISLFFAFSLLEMSSWNDFTFEVRIILILVAFILVVIEMYRFVTSAERELANVIASSDTEGIAIQGKYHQLKMVAAAVCVILAVNVIFDFVLIVEEWIQELFVAISELVISIGFLTIYRRKPIGRYQFLRRTGEDENSRLVITEVEDVEQIRQPLDDLNAVPRLSRDENSN